jgi:hypothetical protein
MVIQMWLSIYLCGWLMTAVTVFAVADGYSNQRDGHRAPSATSFCVLAIVAGALWPVLLAGAIELACVVGIAAKVRAARTRVPEHALVSPEPRCGV